jgi:hypothetical protein
MRENGFFSVKSLVNPGSRSLLAAIVTGDFAGDGDVDGSDLSELIANPELLEIATFAENFGRIGNQ